MGYLLIICFGMRFAELKRYTAKMAVLHRVGWGLYPTNKSENDE
jgi:hypothetical protein